MAGDCARSLRTVAGLVPGTVARQNSLRFAGHTRRRAAESDHPSEELIVTTTPEPYGRLGIGPRGREVQIERRFRAPIDEVWAAMTESDRLERWIGRWEGDPATGKVTFFM